MARSSELGLEACDGPVRLVLKPADKFKRTGPRDDLKERITVVGEFIFDTKTVGEIPIVPFLFHL